MTLYVRRLPCAWQTLSSQEVVVIGNNDNYYHHNTINKGIFSLSF